MGVVGKEKKFREPSSVTRLKEYLPVQYGGSYDINSCNNGYEDVLRSVNGRSVLQKESHHKDMKRKYRQISMGFGRRSDFTKLPQQKHDPGFVYDMDGAISIKQSVSRYKQSNKVLNTFGSTYDAYDKCVANHGLQHWKGRGPGCNLSNDGSDLSLIRKKGHAFSQSRDDRGLLLKGDLKQQKSSRSPGPGDYSTVDPVSIQGQLRKSLKSRSPLKCDSAMSRASRDIQFSRYASGNSYIYQNGLI